MMVTPLSPKEGGSLRGQAPLTPGSIIFVSSTHLQPAPQRRGSMRPRAPVVPSQI